MKGLFGMGKKEQKEPKPADGKWLVQYDKKGCIGAATCEAVYPERWNVQGSGKAELKGSKSSDGITLFELQIGQDEFDKMKAAAEGCPKNVIHIINKETGEKII
ncbi:MAG: ferredoxin [Candidatus Aenigmarchaeota archaeon]|nr:ferredoxin [Candidatus Aenigmarchaeota archaeon]